MHATVLWSMRISLTWNCRAASLLDCAWQVPSMAMLIFKISDTMEGQPFDICSKRFGMLLHESVCGFESGRLPGDLGDTFGALETGEGAAANLAEGLAERAARGVCLVSICARCACLGGAYRPCLSTWFAVL